MKKYLAVSVILLFISVCVIPSTSRLMEQPTAILYDGNTIYVGGDGHGNYTKIQDAIDNASDGDTVFVYNGTYYECLIVNKSINLVGEHKEGAIIVGVSSPIPVIRLDSPSIFIENFMIGKAEEIWSHYGIDTGKNYIENISISSCIFTSIMRCIELYRVHNGSINNCYFKKRYSVGIYLSRVKRFTVNRCQFEGNFPENWTMAIFISGESDNQCENIRISKCYMTGNWFGIYVSEYTRNIEIYDNIIIGNELVGISINPPAFEVLNSDFIIQNNTISGNGKGELFDAGISIQGCDNVVIRDNNISSNKKYGIRFFISSNNVIQRNNFIDNDRDAFFEKSFKNKWNSNFWDSWIGLKCIIFKKCPKLILGKLNYFIPQLNFDWHPAKEPYDIGG